MIDFRRTQPGQLAQDIVGGTQHRTWQFQGNVAIAKFDCTQIPAKNLGYPPPALPPRKIEIIDEICKMVSEFRSGEKLENGRRLF